MKRIMFNDTYGLTEAVLNGDKVQTRRIIGIERPSEKWAIAFPLFENSDIYESFEDMQLHAPLFGAFKWINTENENEQTGWIIPKFRKGEVVALVQSYKNILPNGLETPFENIDKTHAGWNNKMFVKAHLMPHQVQITRVRLERLQNISDADCMKEGVETECNDVYFYKGSAPFDTAREAFASLINKVSGKGTWERNPHVFVYDFKLVK